MDFWKNVIIPHRVIIIISLSYFFLHLINLTLLPIFNDESIYIDWGWSHTHMPGHLYDALLDAKQPLMIWLFGIFQNFFADPLFAGRFVSVLFGLMTMLGIYTLAKKIANAHVAVISTVIFSIIPIFVFYNRQALFEAAVACVGIWSCVALINLVRTPSTKNSILLGIILGIGFFIKSSSLLFIVSAIAILMLYIIVKKQVVLLKSFFIALVAFFCVDFLLLINPLFWETFSSNSRYAFTLSELLSFPISTWGTNLLGFFEIGFVFVTPFVFFASLAGIYLFRRKKLKNSMIFLLFFLIALVLEIISGKTQSQRYIVSFLPFLIIPAAYVFYLLWKGAVWKKSIVVISCMVPFVVSLLLIFSPESYILQSEKVSRYSDVAHVRGQTSGHGINEAMMYINEQSKGQPTMVLFGFNIGNPESAVNLYSQRTPNLASMHIDAQMFADIEKVECFTSQYPVFLVTRNDQRLGMDRYFTLEKSFLNPDKTYSVSIYTLKSNCVGNTNSLSDIYHPTMNKIFQMKAGIY
jgi:4-amino-4-deoxy-L-arabinose transferase-like glycosyltransferase